MNIQYEALLQLAHTFRMMYEDCTPGSTAKVCKDKVESHLAQASLQSQDMYNSLESVEKIKISSGMTDIITDFITRFLKIKIEVDRESTELNRTMPIDVML